MIKWIIFIVMWSDCVPDRLSPKDITEPRARLSHTLWSISNARVTLPQRRDHACSFRFFVKNRRIFVSGLCDWQNFYPFALHENTRTKYRLRRSNASVTLPQRRDHAWSFRFLVKPREFWFVAFAIGKTFPHVVWTIGVPQMQSIFVLFFYGIVSICRKSC